jgi:hypothetical protein
MQRLSRSGVLPVLLSSYLVCLPVQIETNFGIRFAPSDIFLILYVVTAAGSLRFYRARVFSVWHAAVLLAFAMATFMTALTTGQINQYAILNKDIGVLTLFVSYGVIACECGTWADIRRYLRIFIISVTLINTCALISYWNLSPWLTNHVFTINEVYTGRLAGMLVDPNAYGGLLAVAFAIHTMTYFSRKQIIGGLFGWYILPCLLTGVLYTYSRSTWISITIILAILCVVRPKTALMLWLGIGGAFAALIISMDQASLDRMIYFASRPEQVESRIDIISHALPMFIKSPLLGIGLSVFNDEYGIIIHNTPVWFLTEFGVAGFLAVAGLYAWIMRVGIQAYKMANADEKPLLLGVMLGHIAILGLSMGIEAFYQRHWWLCMAVIIAASTITRREAARRLDSVQNAPLSPYI